MVTDDTIRELALALPRTTEVHREYTSQFRVSGRPFVVLSEDGYADVLVDEPRGLEAAAADPDAFVEQWEYGRFASIRVLLDAAERGRVAELITDAWRQKAPTTIVAAFDRERRHRLRGH